MHAGLKAAGLAHEGFLVQRMAAPGPELIVGVVGDPRFGQLVAVGAGGTTAADRRRPGSLGPGRSA